LNTSEQWIVIPDADALEPENVMRFDHGDHSFALTRAPEGDYFATAGLCTHEAIHLADGVVDGDILVCPKHFAEFDYRTGEAKAPPACIDLKTFEVKVEDGAIFIKL
jgi:3-phenylpropionate/trans-cinnamate dioxygenase ferredoxin subunit